MLPMQHFGWMNDEDSKCNKWRLPRFYGIRTLRVERFVCNESFPGQFIGRQLLHEMHGTRTWDVEYFGMEARPGDLLGDRIFPPLPQAPNYSSDFITRHSTWVLSVHSFFEWESSKKNCTNVTELMNNCLVDVFMTLTLIVCYDWNYGTTNELSD